MADTSKVQFPGQKKRRVKMRGTKQANASTANRMKKQLRALLNDPHAHLPDMQFKQKLAWGRTDPVTKTLKEMETIVRKKNDLKWLSKRMMAKRGDPVAKAFAGSLHAAHDETFTMVGHFNSQSFGSASFIRRGDGKQGYMAGLQNFSNTTLRMLPWEDHAKRGMFFFSWEGGFVCTGPNPNPPQAWLADVLTRSRFEFEHHEVSGTDIYVTSDLDAADVLNRSERTGHVALQFHHGPVVGLGFEALTTFTKKDEPFIHHLALSMLPPLLPSILDVRASWYPQGWPEEAALPGSATEGIERALDAWQGLTMNEGLLATVMREAVLEGIEDGVIVDEQWVAGDSVENLEEALSACSGSDDERHLAAHILHGAVQQPHEDVMHLRIEAKGSPAEREQGATRIMKGASCGDVLSAFWATHGLEALTSLNLEGDEAELIWSEQLERPKPFGKFLKGLDQARHDAQRRARFPELTVDQGPAAAIHRYTVNGLLKGMGAMERQATARHDSVDDAAAAWAWLMAVGRSGGQEWHFETNARDRGGAWSQAASRLHQTGQRLLDVEDAGLDEAREAWQDAYNDLRKATGA